jgi:hypothetical protein
MGNVRCNINQVRGSKSAFSGIDHSAGNCCLGAGRTSA